MIKFLRLNCSQPVNKLPEINRKVNTEAAAHRCSVAVKKNQKQRLADLLCNIQSKTPVLESLFNKVAALQLSCEYCKICKNSFFHKTPLVAASGKIDKFFRKTSVAEA